MRCNNREGGSSTMVVIVNTLSVLQQRQGLSTGLASLVSSSKTATLTRSWKATQARTLCIP